MAANWSIAAVKAVDHHRHYYHCKTERPLFTNGYFFLSVHLISFYLHPTGSISPTVQFGDGSTAELVTVPGSNRLALNNLSLAYSTSGPTGNGSHSVAAAAAAANHAAAAAATVSVNNGGWPGLTFFDNGSGYPTVMGQATAGGGAQGLELNNVRLATAANQLGQYGKWDAIHLIPFPLTTNQPPLLVRR